MAQSLMLSAKSKKRTGDTMAETTQDRNIRLVIDYYYGRVLDKLSPIPTRRFHPEPLPRL